MTALPSTYRGWAIHYEDWARCYEATGPDYDADWRGEEDGWEDNGHRVQADSLRGIYAEIDAFYDDNHYNDMLDDLGDAEHERRSLEA